MLHVRFWPKADIRKCSARVRYWGKADIGRSLIRARGPITPLSKCYFHPCTSYLGPVAQLRSVSYSSSWRMEVLMTEIPSWHITGDWFDNCSCAVACPCTFAQPPDNGFCEGVLFWHIRNGHYGDINLDGLSFVRVGRWEGAVWAGKVKGTAGI